MDDMLARMSSHRLTEWMAYAQVEPFGDELMDVHFATLEALIRNANRGQNEQAVEPEKFRLWNNKKHVFDPQEFFDRLKTALK